MAKRSTNKSSGATKHGKVPEGWTQISFQVPAEMAKIFRDLGAESGYGGVKLLGTAAIGFITSLDPGRRKILFKYVQEKTWADPGGLEVARLRALVAMLLSEEEGKAPMVEPQWFVDKIADPELSQPPGRKASDRTDRERKKSG